MFTFFFVYRPALSVALIYFHSVGDRYHFSKAAFLFASRVYVRGNLSIVWFMNCALSRSGIRLRRSYFMRRENRIDMELAGCNFICVFILCGGFEVLIRPLRFS